MTTAHENTAPHASPLNSEAKSSAPPQTSPATSKPGNSFHLKIIHRIFLGYSLGVLAFGWLSFATYYGIQALSKITDQAYQHPFLVSNATMAIRADITEAQLNLSAMASATSTNERLMKYEALENAHKRTRQNFTIIRERFLGNQEDAQDAFTLFKQFSELNLTIAGHLIEGDQAQAKQLTTTENIKLVRDLTEKINAIHEFARARSIAFRDEAQNMRKDIKSKLIFAILFGAFIMIVAGLMVNNSITRPLGRLRRAMRSLADGNINMSVPERERRDEIGDMANALEVFREIYENQRRMERAQNEAEKRLREAETARLNDQVEATARAMEMLDRKVQERTRELGDSNDALRHEIEKRTAAEIDLKQALQAIELASSAKSNFLAHMSHELRTPLNAVLGFSELIKNKIDNGAEPKLLLPYMDIISSAGNTLLDLVETILDLTKIGNKIEDIDRHPESIPGLMDDVMKPTLAKAQDKQIDIVRDLSEDDLPLYVERNMIVRALTNILCNAVKFTPGPSTVTITGYAEGAFYKICFKDEGIGIHPDDVERIMEPFSQADSTFNRRFEGSGLGLPLAKRIIELHGGSLTLSSNPGSGTLVVITLPLYQPKDQSQESGFVGETT